ncbi:MAG: sulfurtransferase TusA family protein [Pacificimonas sp.]
MNAQTDKSAAETAIDARGLRCPLPVLRLRKVALSLPADTPLTLSADDPAANRDVPAFCVEMGWHCETLGSGKWRIRRLG